MPDPQNKKELRSFLGMVKYYDRFSPGLATKCSILNDLLKKGLTWKWTEQHSKAVDLNKNTLTSTQILAYYDPNLPLSLACDASAVGIGAVLFHTYSNGKEKPVAFPSRKLTSAEQNYAQIEREALAVVNGVRKFRQYLLGRNFFLIANHKPLTTIFNPKRKFQK